MEILYWFLIGLVAFIYFGFPVIMFLLARIFGKEPEKQDITPSVSLIIAAHNEEKVIRDKILNSLALDYPQEKLEIIFALDACTDTTKEIISGFSDSRITIVGDQKRSGKVAILNKTVPLAKGEILIFSDANSIYKTDALKKIVRNFAEEKVGCVAGKLSYTDADHTCTGKGENLYWKYETFIKIQESRLGKLLVTNGSIQAVRKSVYPFPDPEVADDFSIPILIQAQGHKVLYEPQAIACEVATQNLKEEMRQKVRIVAQGFKGIARLNKDLLKLGGLGLFELIFHKLLRWEIGLYMAAILVINVFLAGQPLYFYLFLAQILFYCLASAGLLLEKHNRTKIFYIPLYFCLVNFAAIIALFNLLKNKDTHVWDKAHSTRTIKENV